MRCKILHIGLGKCGSTFLQKSIFPEIEKKTKIKFFTMNEIQEFKFDINHHSLENITQLEDKLSNDFILSYEGLFSHTWEFNKIQKGFELIKKNFSNDTVIFLVLRNPYDLLNSIYVQNIMQMQISKPNKFFFIEKNNLYQKYRYNLDQFDYNILVSLYKNYFKKVVVVKYEELHELSYLKELFQYKIDRKFKLKKYKINKDYIPLNLDKMDRDYYSANY